MKKLSMKLPALFQPDSVAVVGASTNLNKIGSQILSNIKTGGFKGQLYPVNPKGGQILGLKVYPKLKDIPQTPDLAVVAVKPKIALEVIRQAVEIGVKSLVVISAGFKETSSEGAKLEKEIQDILTHSQTRLLGVNCLGLLSYAKAQSPLNATFLNKLPDNGQVAFASQSGAFGSAVVDWADKIKLGFKYFVSLGNKTDLNEIDFLKAWNDDDEVKVIALYLENIASGQEFIETIKTITPKKPVILLMPGASAEAKKAITSHTGSLVNDEAVLQLVFDKYNLIRASHMRQFFKLILMANVLTSTQSQVRPGKNSLILTNAGGPGVLATDLLEKYQLKLAQLLPETKSQLKQFLPEAASVKNPVDVLGDAQADRYQQALATVVKDKNVDQVFIILTPQTITEVEKTAQVIIEQTKLTNKLLVPIFIGGSDVKVGLDLLRQKGVPAYSYIIDAVEAVAKIDQYYQKLHLTSTKTSVNHQLTHLDHKVIDFCQATNAQLVQHSYQGRLDPKLGESLLKLLKLPLPPSKFLLVNELVNNPDNLDRLNELEKQISYPWVIKLASNKVLHNTDIKGVYTNITNQDEAIDSIKKLIDLTRANNLTGAGTYIQIQKQVNNEVEVFAGIKKDPDFGHVLVLGSGGIYANLYEDVTKILLPTSEAEITTQLKKTKVSRLLTGYRQGTAYDMTKVVNLLTKISLLPTLLPNLKEADFNPIIVNQEGAFIADAKLIW